MTGLDPRGKRHPPTRRSPGIARCLALLYRGPEAINKIRNILGPLIQEGRAWQSSQDLWRRHHEECRAHASDAVENAERERKIIGLVDNKGPVN